MDALDRRSLLAATGSSLVFASSGCLSDTPGPIGGSDDIECEQVTDYDAVDAYPRVDEPPHTVPGSNDEHQLGACMEDTPTMDFEQIGGEDVPLQLESDDVGVEMDRTEPGFWTDLVADGDTRDAVFDLDTADEGLREELRAVELDNSVLVPILSGMTNSSFEHQWVRVESREGGIHAHGYILLPEEQLDDLTAHTSVLAVPYDELPEFVMVSMTISPEVRVNFDSTEGGVRIDHRIGGSGASADT